MYKSYEECRHEWLRRLGIFSMATAAYSVKAAKKAAKKLKRKAQKKSRKKNRR